MAVQLLGMPTTLGLPRRALRHAPEALRSLGLVRSLERYGVRVEDLGDLTLPSHPAKGAGGGIQSVVETAYRQARFWLNRQVERDLMLTIGGDHSASLGTIWALHEMGHSFDVVWIDAHGDFNVAETSPSGNAHGMVLALACGLIPSAMSRIVEPNALHLWGIRDLDVGERALLADHQVSVYSPDAVRSQWTGLIDRLGPDVYISFDIDSVEPTEAPGTLTPVPGGFSRREALKLVADIARQRNVLALDIVECHPDQDRGHLTTNLAIAVAQTVVSKQFDRRYSTGIGTAGIGI
jgi:arginase